VNKSELIDAIAKHADISKAAAGRALDATVNSIKSSLLKGDIVTLVGFGSFYVGKRTARAGRNPRTGATIEIEAAKVPKFRAGKELKDSLNERSSYKACARPGVAGRAGGVESGCLAQPVERRPYKANVGSSILSAPTSGTTAARAAATASGAVGNNARSHDAGVVVQLVRIPACHAGGRGFESRPLRQTSEGDRKDRPFL
jgi:DNA-binding protein HU-beta